MNLVKSDFKKPYFIEELGEQGLTAKDISESLCVPLESVHKKLRRERWHSETIKEWKIIPYGIQDRISNLGQGFVKLETFALNTRAAKVFVTRWNNRISDQYLNFLFDCENVAVHLTPKLIQKVNELESEIVTLKSTSNEHKKLIKKASKKGMLLTPVFEENLFGKLEARYELKKKNEVDDTLQSIAQLKHISKVNEGLSKKIELITDKLLQLELQQRNTNLLLAKGNK